MKISVITLAFRPGGFDVVSAALAAQVDAPEFEWIIVDELHRWRAPVVADRLAALPFAVKHLATERSLFPIASTMRAGNTALKAATGDLIVYCCDYASPPPDFLAKHWALFAKGEKAIGVSTYRMREVTGWCAPIRAVDVYERLIAGTFDHGNLWSYFVDGEGVMQPPVHVHVPQLDDWCAHYKVDSVPREALFEVNGWDEEYDGAYAYGDVDMTIRLRRAGWNPQAVDVTVDILDSHRAVLRMPEASFRDYDAPRLLARLNDNPQKYRCDFGIKLTVDGHRRTLEYVSKHGIMFTGGKVAAHDKPKVIMLANRPWLGRTKMFMSAVDCFVWQHVKPPMLVLCEDTMRLVEAAADPASSFDVDVGFAHGWAYGAVVVGGRPDFDETGYTVLPGGRLIYKGDHVGGQALIDWATANGWPVHAEEFGPDVCGVVAQKPEVSS